MPLPISIRIPKNEEFVGNKRFLTPIQKRNEPVCPDAPCKPKIERQNRPSVRLLNFDLNFDDCNLDDLTPPKIKRIRND